MIVDRDPLPIIPTGHLVILSGGIDSSTLLAWVIELTGKEEPIMAVTFNYGSKHAKREIEAAAAIAEYYKIPHEVIRLRFMQRLFKSALLLGGEPIPKGHYEDPSMQKTVVPFRNGIMLSIAAGLAESKGYNRLYYGAHAGDHAIYPDCRRDWVVAMSKSILMGTYNAVRLTAPFVEYRKEQIVDEGARLQVPFYLTYSCYEGRPHHCGECGTCVERQEAFSKAGVEDPTFYEEIMEAKNG